MPKRQPVEPKKPIIVRIPRSLHREVSLLLLDPKSGKIKYGAMASLMTQLLQRWVDSQRKKPASSENEHDRT